MHSASWDLSSGLFIADCWCLWVWVDTETLHSNGNLPSLCPARYYCRTDQSCLGETAPKGLKTVPHETHDWYSKSGRQEIHPPKQSDLAISFPVMHSSSQRFPSIGMFETKDFVWIFAVPLFLCCALSSGVGRTFIDEKPYFFLASFALSRFVSARLGDCMVVYLDVVIFPFERT